MTRIHIGRRPAVTGNQVFGEVLLDGETKEGEPPGQGACGCGGGNVDLPSSDRSVPRSAIEVLAGKDPAGNSRPCEERIPRLFQPARRYRIVRRSGTDFLRSRLKSAVQPEDERHQYGQGASLGDPVDQKNQQGRMPPAVLIVATSAMHRLLKKAGP